jgi:hypothetical protein
LFDLVSREEMTLAKVAKIAKTEKNCFFSEVRMPFLPLAIFAREFPNPTHPADTEHCTCLTASRA